MAGKPNRRKSFYIERKFQNRFILSYVEIIVLSVIVSILVSILYTFFSSEFGDNQYRVIFLKVVNGEQMLIKPLSIVFPIVALSSLLTIIVSIITALLYSHKIAGPIYRLKKSSEDFLAGKKNVSFKIREKDEFQELSQAMQKISEKYHILEKELEEYKAKHPEK